MFVPSASPGKAERIQRVNKDDCRIGRKLKACGMLLEKSKLHGGPEKPFDSVQSGRDDYDILWNTVCRATPCRCSATHPPDR